MNDDPLKAAFKAASDILPDTHFCVLLVAEIPAFGSDKIGPVDVMTAAGPQQTEDVILGLARSIEKRRAAAVEPKQLEPEDDPMGFGSGSDL